MKKLYVYGLFASSLLFSGSKIFAQNIAINTSGAAAASTRMLEVTQGSTAADMVALYAIHNGATGAGISGYGLQAIKTGATGINVAGYFSASGGGSNHAIIVPSGGGRVGIGTSTPSYLLETVGDIYANGGWFRASGNQGLYFESWGGGWYMSDGTWIRSYGSKNVYIDQFLRADAGIASGAIASLGAGTMHASSWIRGNGFQDYNGNTVIDQGGGWHRSYGATGWYNGTYGGGWYMTDASWVKNYNAKPLYITGDATYSGVFMSGKVGIGTATPSYLLHVTGSETGAGGLNFPIAYVENTNNTGVAIIGSNTAADGAAGGTTVNGFGVQGSTNQQYGQGVYGSNASTGAAGPTNFYYGIKGISTTVSAALGTIFGVGVTGWVNQASGVGMYGKNFQTNGTGILGVGNGLTSVYVAYGAGGQFYGQNRGSINRTRNATSSGNAYRWNGVSLTDPTSYTYGAVYGGCDFITTGSYNFGVHGQVWITGASGLRNGGTLGSLQTGEWTSLGYKSSGAITYASYGSAAMTTGAGRLLGNSSQTGTGFGFYGGVLGGWVRGNVYGINVKGERYSMYVDGKTYTNDVIAQLSSNAGSRDRVVTYVPTSTSVDIYAKGIAALSGGRTVVKFDETYSKMISSEVPVIVTVTPMGKSNGVYIESVSTEGFTIVENNDGTSSVKFSWIAVGTKRGYENPSNPEELISGDYDSNMNDVMFNENNQIDSAKPMWWDGSKLRFDPVPFVEGETPKEFSPGSLHPSDGPLPEGWEKPR